MYQVIDVVLVEFAQFQSNVADFPSHVGDFGSHLINSLVNPPF